MNSRTIEALECLKHWIRSGLTDGEFVIDRGSNNELDDELYSDSNNY